jgi:GNAT superfamily N-acetyltransferase
MEIRKAVSGDIDKIMDIYSSARLFMREQGNPDQWWDGYPPRELIEADISEGECRLVTDGDEILAVFYTAWGIDPTYVKMYDGEWSTDEPYGVLHRVAVSPLARGRGVAGFIFSEMLKKFGRIRIDTHEKNIPMQKALEKAGFTRRGIIYIKDPEGLTSQQRELCKRVGYDNSLKQ